MRRRRRRGRWVTIAVVTWLALLALALGGGNLAYEWWGPGTGSTANLAADVPAETPDTEPAPQVTETPTPAPTTPEPTSTVLAPPDRADARAVALKPKPTETPTPTKTPTRTASPSPPPSDQESDSDPEPSSRAEEYELEVVRLTNQVREEAGCGPLRVDSALREAARAHSSDMAESGYFDHNSQDGRSPWDRMRDAGYDSPGAENIAKGQRTPREVMYSWMTSEGHRRNIVNCDLKAIGVGVALSGDGPYWTQDFGYA